jgi:hypothetical protein
MGGANTVAKLGSRKQEKGQDPQKRIKAFGRFAGSTSSFLGAAPAQRKHHDSNFAWAISELVDCILNFPTLTSKF